MAAGQPEFIRRQYEFAAHIRDPDNRPAPSDVEDRRMAIYRELFYNNVEGFIASGFPVLRSVYNDEDWHRMVRDFFANHQSTSPYFLEISQEFLAYLEHEREPRAEDPAGLLELAHYEWVELALTLSDADQALPPLDPNGDLLSGHPVISPLAWPLSYRFPVHRIGPDDLPTEPPSSPTYLVVYRDRHDKVGFLEINPVTKRLLELVGAANGQTGRQVLEQIAAEMNHPDRSEERRVGKECRSRWSPYH